MIFCQFLVELFCGFDISIAGCHAGQCADISDIVLLLRINPLQFLVGFSGFFFKQDELKLPADKSLGFDCTTCHNIHQQASRDPEYYREICLIFHRELKGHAPACSQENLDNQCLKCHMPAVNFLENLYFTDRWISNRGFDRISVSPIAGNSPLVRQGGTETVTMKANA